MSDSRILSPAQIEEFVIRGFVVLRHAFSSVVAARIRAALWSELGLDADDPSGWTRPSIELPERALAAPFASAVTGRLKGAIDDLCGTGRWRAIDRLAFWPTAFPGTAAADASPESSAWQLVAGSGGIRFDAIDVGIVPVILFSDVAPDDGALHLVEGSHATIGRALAAAGAKGLGPTELAENVRQAAKTRVAHLGGRAGDIILMHPLAVFARAAVASRQVRFAAETTVILRTPLRQSGDGLSPVERALVRSSRPSIPLGV